MNKKGQMVMVGIMVMVMAVLIFIATLPAIKDLMDTARQADNLNCGGYVHETDPSKSYNSTLDEDTLSCTIMDLGIPYLILGVLVGLIAKLLHGKLVERVEEPPSYGYPGY